MGRSQWREERERKAARRRYYTLLAVARAELHMEEEDYRELLRRCGAREVNGRVSATTMTLEQMIEAMREMRRLGFRPGRPGQSAAAAGRRAQIAKIRALWHALADAGVVRSRDERAMRAWCRRIIDTERLEWAEPEALRRCIEALKQWRDRTK